VEWHDTDLNQSSCTGLKNNSADGPFEAKDQKDLTKTGGSDRGGDRTSSISSSSGCGAERGFKEQTVGNREWKNRLMRSLPLFLRGVIIDSEVKKQGDVNESCKKVGDKITKTQPPFNSIKVLQASRPCASISKRKSLRFLAANLCSATLSLGSVSVAQGILVRRRGRSSASNERGGRGLFGGRQKNHRLKRDEAVAPRFRGGEEKEQIYKYSGPYKYWFPNEMRAERGRKWDALCLDRNSGPLGHRKQTPWSFIRNVVKITRNLYQIKSSLNATCPQRSNVKKRKR